jgi:hypothetical protein
VLLLTRTLTALTAAFVLFILFMFGILAIGAAILGASAAVKNNARDYASGANAAREAGELFDEHGGGIMIGAAGAAVIVSGVLSFTGVFPWCRKRRDEPPPLP